MTARQLLYQMKAKQSRCFHVLLRIKRQHRLGDKMDKKQLTITIENRDFGYNLYIGDTTLILDFRTCSIYYAMVNIIKVIENKFAFHRIYSIF